MSLIKAGNFHTCSISTAGVLKCWGSGSSAQLGNGTQSDSATPATVLGITAGTISKISVRGSHACVVISSAAKCWGSNSYGQIGDESTSTRTTPVAVH